MHKLKLTSIAAVWIALFGIVAFFSMQPLLAHANPSAFARVQTNAATTTFSAIGVGSGTTTLTYTSSNGNLAADSAVLDIRYNASTTAPVLGMRIEHSYDGIDWYAEVPTNTSASSTAATFTENRFTFSTTTDSQFGSPGSGIGTAASSSIMREVLVTTPTRFTRIVMYGISGNGSLYAEVVAKAQLSN